ncbi:hypothetical protein IF1G_05590 [Cordyceps javanica]|uniref:Uncharacterized protein n=1 Tax=Cordyceps javanica TaxID=43265 RepID=A0A545V214_9HYPO|nr:hypothetical protein IF1G_05590 [Cordyceps javanica]
MLTVLSAHVSRQDWPWYNNNSHSVKVETLSTGRSMHGSFTNADYERLWTGKHHNISQTSPLRESGLNTGEMPINHFKPLEIKFQGLGMFARPPASNGPFSTHTTVLDPGCCSCILATLYSPQGVFDDALPRLLHSVAVLLIAAHRYWRRSIGEYSYTKIFLVGEFCWVSSSSLLISTG